jgi:hypothetical protein
MDHLSTGITKPFVNVDPLPVGLARYYSLKANRPGSSKHIGRSVDISPFFVNAWPKACVLDITAKTSILGASGLDSHPTGP